MVTGAWLAIGIAAGVRSEDWWGFAFLTFFTDFTILYFYL